MKANFPFLLCTLKAVFVGASFLTIPRKPVALLVGPPAECRGLYAKVTQDDSVHTASSSRPDSIETRRCFVQKIANGVIFGGIAFIIQSNTVAVASDDGTRDEVTQVGAGRGAKPYAPLDALLPATRVRVLIDRAVEAAKELVELAKQGNAAEEKAKRREELVSALSHLLLDPHEFVTEKESVSSRKGGSTWTEWAKARQKQAQTEKMIDAKPLVRAVEMFEQSGERRQWNRLKRQEKRLERSNDMRAAFNTYTSNLVFGEGYTLNASKEEKSRLIRKYDQLPDVTSVIRADLDLRDLYRNQVLTSMDDAQAEWKYQTKNNDGKIAAYDAAELLGLLRDAQRACMEWFKFAPEDDVREALNVVLAEY